MHDLAQIANGRLAQLQRFFKERVVTADAGGCLERTGGISAAQGRRQSATRLPARNPFERERAS